MRVATPSARQTGGALLVTMVMIFMLSIMGVSAMRSSTLEHRMASNAIQASTVFQAAESSTEIVLNNSARLNAAWNANGAVLNDTTDLKLTDAMNSGVELQWVGEGAAPAWSIGQGSNNFMSLRFVVRGEAGIDGVGASASVSQGAYRIVPAP